MREGGTWKQFKRHVWRIYRFRSCTCDNMVYLFCHRKTVKIGSVKILKKFFRVSFLNLKDLQKRSFSVNPRKPTNTKKYREKIQLVQNLIFPNLSYLPEYWRNYFIYLTLLYRELNYSKITFVLCHIKSLSVLNLIWLHDY